MLLASERADYLPLIYFISSNLPLVCSLYVWSIYRSIYCSNYRTIYRSVCQFVS